MSSSLIPQVVFALFSGFASGVLYGFVFHLVVAGIRAFKAVAFGTVFWKGGEE